MREVISDECVEINVSHLRKFRRRLSLWRQSVPSQISAVRLIGHKSGYRSLGLAAAQEQGQNPNERVCYRQFGRCVKSKSANIARIAVLVVVLTATSCMALRLSIPLFANLFAGLGVEVPPRIAYFEVQFPRLALTILIAGDAVLVGGSGALAWRLMKKLS